MLLVNKPINISSFQVVEKVRKLTGIKKVGHAGTLDPLAEGLLIILIGKEETKKAKDFLGLDKEYEAIARLGISTDTGDLEGKIVKKKTCEKSFEEIKNALLKLKGRHLWEVPKYSAIKVDGKPLYFYARQNIKIEIPKKEMEIKNIELIDIKENDEFIDVRYMALVSSGTYIRTVSEKLGELLGCPSTTAHIKRTKIGTYSLDDAINFEDLENYLKSKAIKV